MKNDAFNASAIIFCLIAITAVSVVWATALHAVLTSAPGALVSVTASLPFLGVPVRGITRKNRRRNVTRTASSLRTQRRFALAILGLLALALAWVFFGAFAELASAAFAAASAVPAARVDYLRNLASGKANDAENLLRENILGTFWNAHDAERADGLAWYDDAHNFARATADEYDTKTAVVANVISALSPLNDWETNKADALTLYDVLRAGSGPAGLTVCTFGNQKVKAWHIAQYEDPSFQSGNKTEAFARCITDPADEYAVTVDRHALAVALNAPRGGAKKVSLTDARYKRIADAYRDAADHLRGVGYPDILPLQVQAVTWVVWRRLHGGNKRFERRPSDGSPVLFDE